MNFFIIKISMKIILKLLTSMMIILIIIMIKIIVKMMIMMMISDHIDDEHCFYDWDVNEKGYVQNNILWIMTVKFFFNIK